jgi:four helix bundle protein
MEKFARWIGLPVRKICDHSNRDASIPANIVEGCAREGGGDYLRFLDIAFGSTRELIYLTGLSQRLEFMEPGAARIIENLGGRTAAALAALRASLR